MVMRLCLKFYLKSSIYSIFIIALKLKEWVINSRVLFDMSFIGYLRNE